MSTTTHQITAEELMKLPRDRFRYELVKGELLTMSPAGAEHGAVVVNLTAPLAVYVKANNLGVVFGAETGFILERNPDTVLAPDIAFIRRERIGTLSKGYWEGAPDLAVEVVSPGESKNKIEEKTAKWLQFGSSAVWLVNPQTRTVEVRIANGQRKLLCEQDDLTGEDVVPGFRLPVSEIFF
jgi:Uma2 family endonuclease